MRRSVRVSVSILKGPSARFKRLYFGVQDRIHEQFSSSPVREHSRIALYKPWRGQLSPRRYGSCCCSYIRQAWTKREQSASIMETQKCVLSVPVAVCAIVGSTSVGWVGHIIAQPSHCTISLYYFVVLSHYYTVSLYYLILPSQCTISLPIIYASSNLCTA